jgi:hypothetical protein
MVAYDNAHIQNNNGGDAAAAVADDDDDRFYRQYIVDVHVLSAVG